MSSCQQPQKASRRDSKVDSKESRTANTAGGPQIITDSFTAATKPAEVASKSLYRQVKGAGSLAAIDASLNDVIADGGHGDASDEEINDRDYGVNDDGAAGYNSNAQGSGDDGDFESDGEAEVWTFGDHVIVFEYEGYSWNYCKFTSTLHHYIC